MSERRAAAKGRRLGSSRRKQLRESSGEAPAPAPDPSEEPPWASEIVQRVQQLLSARDTEQAGVVTRSDVQRLQEEGLPCSREELELVFDGLDAAGTGRLGTEEFTAGLRQFLSSQTAAREHRRRKTASRRVRLVLPSPALPGGDSEERRHFAAFMEQLGTGNLSEEQEIWQLWVKLRQDEPQLLDNLEEFLAKMRHRIQEARSEKEALELTLNKRVAEHHKDVQQLCEVLEQQIQQEQLRLQQQSVSRSHQQGEELQRALDASEREVQRLVTAQMELERRCRSLQSSQQVTSTENRQLEESNRALEQHLQLLHQQLQQTQGRLRTMRAAVVWEHTGEPGGRVVAELPIEVPMSPQLSPGTSEKFRSEMRIRLGSQSSESKAKGTHQVVWEVLPAEINISGAPQKASSAEEDPFPESLKEEGVSDQSSLLREMNDAIAALSKHLKSQALGATPALADTPWDNSEPQTGPEAATAHETTPRVLQETLPGHIHHELLEGDLQEGPATAELGAPEVTQAGASTGAGHCRAQEPGAEQGDSPEKAQRMFFLQGKGAGVEEMVLNVAEHLGESMEAGEQVLMEVEGAERLQEKTAQAKPQLLGEAEEVEIRQRENLEAGLGPPEAGQEGTAVGQCLGMDEQQPGRTLGECVQAPGTALQERAEPALGLETELGEHLEPEPPSWGEAQVEAAHGGDVPAVTVAPDPGVLDEERARTEVQPQGETTDSKVLEVLPARAERAGSSRAGAEEEEVEEAEPREAEQQLQGECARGGAGWRGSAGALEPLAAAVPPTHGQGGEGTDVELMEAQSSTNMELLAGVEADLQVWKEAGSPGTQQGGGVDPGVQLEKNKPEAGLGEEMGAAAVHSEGPSPAQTPVGSPDLCGLFPVKSQALELVEADLQLCGGLSPETPQEEKGERAVQLQENKEEDGAQGQSEQGLSHEPVPHPSEVTLDQREGAGAGLQPGEEAESLGTAEHQSSGAIVQLIAEGDELRVTPGGRTEADLQPLGEAGSSGTEQGGSVDSEVQHLDQEDKEVFLEGDAEDIQEDMMSHEGLSPGAPWGEEGERAVPLEEEEEVDVQRRGEHGLPQEPVLDLQGSGVGHGAGAGEDMQAQEEAESLDTAEHQSSGAIVRLIAEGNELKSATAESTEADLQPLGEAGSSGTEQGGSVDSEVQPLDQVNKAELVEGEAEDAQADLQLCGGFRPEISWGGKGERTVQLQENEEEDGAQGQGEQGLSHEPVPHPSEVTLDQREGTGAGLQPGEEAESLDTAEHQSSGATVQLIAEGDELRVTLTGSTEADLQPLGEAGSSGTGQGGRLNSSVHLLDQVNKAELVEGEAEDAQEDTQLSEGLSSGVSWGGEIGTNVQIEEKDDGAQGQGEGELPQEPVLDLQGSGVTQGEGAGEDMQAQEKAESLVTIEDQGSGANVELIAEGNELKSASAESTEADLQPLGEAGCSGTEQGGSVDSEVQHLDQEDKEVFLEGDAEDIQEDMMSHEGLSPGALWGEESERTVQLEEEEEEAQGQGEHGLPQEPVLDLQGSGVGHGAGADANMQAQEEAESLDTAEHQSSGAIVQLMAEGDELRLAPGGRTEADLQPLSQTDSMGTEQGGNVAPDVHSLDQEDKEELVDVEAEDSWTESQLCVTASPENPQGGGHCAAVQPRDGAGDWGQGQGGCGLMQELVPHPSGVTIRQRRGTDASVQPVEEAVILDTGEDQSRGANVQLIAGGHELTLTLGGSTEADLQPLGEVGSSGTEQGWGLNSSGHLLDQVNKAELVEGEAEDAQADLKLCEGFSLETLWGGEGGRVVQIEEDEEEDGAQGQGEQGLSHEPVPHPNGVTLDQREGTGAGLQPGEEAESLDTAEHQSSGAIVQLIAEGDELRVTPGGRTEVDLQPLGEAGSSGTEQGGNVDSEVQSLDQEEKAELVEGEAEDAQADLQLCGGLSPGAPWGGEGGRAVQNEEDEDDGAHGENGLPQESVLGPEGAQGRQGDGAGAGVQPQEEAESLDTLEAQSTDADVQLFTDQQKPKSGSGGSTESDLTPLGVAGMWEGQQSLTLGLEAALGASPTANPREGAAAADVPTPTEAALCPGPVTAAQDPGLEAKLGACISPEGQELLQGERASAEGKPLDGTHSLEVAQGERLEAGMRNGVKTQGLGLNQGHDDAALASLVSEAPLQISPLKLETMMQEDVLIPDVWRLCAPGQAAQRELQEQVSAQGHERRLHTVAQQPERETPPMMELEHKAAGPAECPKQEVPPASTLHTTAQPEHAGRDQLEMILRDNSLGQRQLLGEQSKGLSVGQREKIREFGQKMSQEGKPSPGEPGAVTAGGAGAAPRACPKAPLDPDHLYNVLFVGDSHVGKTSFLYRLHADTFNPHLAATVGLDYQIKTLVVDNKSFALRLWDSAGQERYRSVTKQFFRKADGVVLMYDITSEYSFSDVRYWLSCIQEAAEDGVAVLLLGNKTDCAAQRQVPTKEGECLAKEHQLMFYECSAASGHNVFESMVSFVRLLKGREDELKNKAEEVPKAPEKKKGCCW